MRAAHADGHRLLFAAEAAGHPLHLVGNHVHGLQHFKGDAADLGKRIDQYIAAQKDNNVYKQEDGLKEVWRTYAELLGVQNYNRTAEYTTKNPVTGNDSPVLTRLVPEKIADDFFELYKNNVVGNDPRYLKFNDEGEYHYYA